MSDSDVTVRIIQPQDNDDLIELSRLTPMEGTIKVYIDRAPQYVNFYNLHGIHGEKLDPEERPKTKRDIWNTLVAEKEGKVVGVMGSAGKTVLFDGQPIRMGYLMDARVHPDYRRQGIVKKIGFTFADKYGFYPLDIIVAYIMRGNKRASKGFQEGGGQTFVGNRAGTFHLYQVSMYRPYFGCDGLNVERATENDKGEIVQLLADFYAGYNFAPVWNEENFDRQMSVSLGYGFDNIRVVRDNDKIVALLGLWDQTPVRQVVVLKNTLIIRLGLAVAKFLRLFFKAPHPPQEGKPMRSLYIKHIACRPGYEPVLKKMIKQATNQVRRAGTHHFIWGAFYHNDPLRDLFKGLTKTEIQSDLYWGTWNTGWQTDPDKVDDRPAFADFSLV